MLNKQIKRFGLNITQIDLKIKPIFDFILDMVNEYVVHYKARENSELCPVVTLQRYLNINTGH